MRPKPKRVPDVLTPRKRLAWEAASRNSTYTEEPETFWKERGVARSLDLNLPLCAVVPFPSFLDGPYQLDGWYVWFDRQHFEKVVISNGPGKLIYKSDLRKVSIKDSDEIWPAFDAVEDNLERYKRKKIKGVAKKLGLSVHQVCRRHKRGWKLVYPKRKYPRGC